MNKNDPDGRLARIKDKLRAFVSARDWAQYHSPKNLVMALTGEVGELSEKFQWLTESQAESLTQQQFEGVRDEVADVQIYLLLLADRLDIDLLDAVDRKIAKNEIKYPSAE